MGHSFIDVNGARISVSDEALAKKLAGTVSELLLAGYTGGTITNTEGLTTSEVLKWRVAATREEMEATAALVQ